MGVSLLKSSIQNACLDNITPIAGQCPYTVLGVKPLKVCSDKGDTYHKHQVEQCEFS